MAKWSKKLEKDGWHFIYNLEGKELDCVTVITYGYSVDLILEDLNTCSHFAHPQEDIKKLVEALKKARTIITLANENPQGLVAGILNPTIEYIDEALALWKGE